MSHHDLCDEYGTMRAGSGCCVDMAKAMVGLHYASKASRKRQRLRSIVKLGTNNKEELARTVEPVKEVEECEIEGDKTVVVDVTTARVLCFRTPQRSLVNWPLQMRIFVARPSTSQVDKLL